VTDGIGWQVEPYTAQIRAWLDAGGHYLANAPPGAILCVTVRRLAPGLWQPTPAGELVGVCLVGRPVARALPQDGSWGEVTRLYLLPGLPHGTASATIRYAAWSAAAQGLRVLISYHDRTRHSGCIYRKAGFRRDGTTTPPALGWGSRAGRTSADYAPTPKRRWRIDL
jgi:hypothetical protein